MPPDPLYRKSVLHTLFVYPKIIISFITKAFSGPPSNFFSLLRPCFWCMCTKFEGYVLVFYDSFFTKVWKEEKIRKINDFLKAQISELAGTIYFRSGMCSLLICWHLHSKFGLAQTKDHRVMNEHNIVICSSC